MWSCLLHILVTITYCSEFCSLANDLWFEIFYDISFFVEFDLPYAVTCPSCTFFSFPFFFFTVASTSQKLDINCKLFLKWYSFIYGYRMSFIQSYDIYSECSTLRWRIKNGLFLIFQRLIPAREVGMYDFRYYFFHFKCKFYYMYGVQLLTTVLKIF